MIVTCVVVTCQMLRCLMHSIHHYRIISVAVACVPIDYLDNIVCQLFNVLLSGGRSRLGRGLSALQWNPLRKTTISRIQLSFRTTFLKKKNLFTFTCK